MPRGKSSGEHKAVRAAREDLENAQRKMDAAYAHYEEMVGLRDQAQENLDDILRIYPPKATAPAPSADPETETA